MDVFKDVSAPPFRSSDFRPDLATAAAMILLPDDLSCLQGSNVSNSFLFFVEVSMFQKQ